MEITGKLAEAFNSLSEELLEKNGIHSMSLIVEGSLHPRLVVIRKNSSAASENFDGIHGLMKKKESGDPIIDGIDNIVEFLNSLK